MYVSNPLRQYQKQAVLSASPLELIDKLYGIGLAAAQNNDAPRTQRALIELAAALDLENGGEIAENLSALYDFALRSTASGDFPIVVELLSGLRQAWRTASETPTALA
ncbi:MAG: hypothetical protein Rubg2KO_36670 [Rubricoccaceae bacterium]